MDLLQNAGRTISEFDKTLQSSMGTIRNRRRTAAHSETHDDKIRFFFGARFFFVFFSFATSCPCFSSFLFFGAAPAERKMKQKTRQTEETENRKTYKSQAFWDLFLREETAKSVGSRRRCCLALGAKKVKIMGVAQ